MKYKVNPPLSDSVINQINRLNDGSTIEFKNTKGLKSKDFKKIKSTIIVRIVGGLDEKEKPKYDAQNYYDRTIYTPKQVAKILEKFEIIESKIEPNWNDLDKAMFIYKAMVENMEYDYNEVLGDNDYNRNLCGILYNMSVCAGFAMIYKELMDRNGIECLYQNRQHSHAWNVLKIDGVYYPVDLTWDVTSKKQDGKCNFIYFGNDPDFFKHKSHMGTNELVVPPNTFSKDALMASYKKINKMKVQSKDTKTIINKNGKEVTYFINQKNEFKELIMITDGKMKVIAYDDDNNLDYFINYDFSKTKDEKFASSKNKDVSNKMKTFLSNVRVITRSDSSQLYVEDINVTHDGVKKYGIMKFDKTNKKLVISTIQSEEILVGKGNNPEKDRFIADVLLKDERIREKIDRCGGYVGFVRNNYGRYQKVMDRDYEMKVSR